MAQGEARLPRGTFVWLEDLLGGIRTGEVVGSRVERGVRLYWLQVEDELIVERRGEQLEVVL